MRWRDFPCLLFPVDNFRFAVVFQTAINRVKVPLIASSQVIDTSEDSPAGKLHLGVLMAVA